MAGILHCILWVSLFQISTNGAGAAEIVGRSVREGDRAANQKINGSYKILNKLVKPFISKRVQPARPDFVFPDDYEIIEKYKDYSKPMIPDDCKRIGICDDIPNYPEEVVNNLIYDLLRHNTTRLNMDELEIPQINQRLGPDAGEELCLSEEKIIAPQAAQDKDMKWHVIVNDKKKPLQTFRLEVCKVKVGSNCSPLAHFQNGYTARCIQKFTLRQMFALDDRNETIEKPFRVPSCCSCVINLDL